MSVTPVARTASQMDSAKPAEGSGKKQKCVDSRLWRQTLGVQDLLQHTFSFLGISEMAKSARTARPWNLAFYQFLGKNHPMIAPSAQAIEEGSALLPQLRGPAYLNAYGVPTLRAVQQKIEALIVKRGTIGSFRWEVRDLHNEAFYWEGTVVNELETAPLKKGKTFFWVITDQPKATQSWAEFMGDYRLLRDEACRILGHQKIEALKPLDDEAQSKSSRHQSDKSGWGIGQEYCFVPPRPIPIEYREILMKMGRISAPIIGTVHPVTISELSQEVPRMKPHFSSEAEYKQFSAICSTLKKSEEQAASAIEEKFLASAPLWTATGSLPMEE